MEKYREADLKVFDAIKESPDKGLYFKDIVNLGLSPEKAHKSLKKLISRGFLSRRSSFLGAYFFISAENKDMNIRKVKCPVCQTVRRSFRDDQRAIRCSNPECKTPSGRHRVFWLVNIDHLRAGAVKKINCI